MKKILRKITYIFTFAYLTNPLLSHAETIDSSNAKTLVKSLTKLINNRVFGLLILFALLNFMYSVVMFIKSADKEDKNEAKERLIWGIIGLFVIISIWAIVFTIANSFGLSVGGVLKTG